MKRRVYLAQIAYQYGTNTFLPYSVGRLWAYAITHQEIVENFELGGFLFLREDIEAVVARLDNPAVLGVSCYIWNWRYTSALAAAVKARWPECLVIAGGPQISEREAAPAWADVVVNGEGEHAFVALLRELLYTDQVTTKRLVGRIGNLDGLPSPYLAGVFDDLMKLPYDWHASQETHRGCPFSCTFCDWGSAVYAKVRGFPIELVEAEIDWFGRHEIDLLYNCDANFGMRKDDPRQVAAMIAAKRRYGFPRKLRAAWAKKHNPQLKQIALDLEAAGMNKGVTLALQSMDDKVLDVIKRRNIKFEELGPLSAWYQEHGVPVYYELILGLPGESYETWADGFTALLDQGCHHGINVYTCMRLENSEMNAPEYREQHRIRTVTMPMLLNHGTPGERDPHQETYDIIVATATMPHIDWRRAYVFSWAIQAFHTLGLTHYIAQTLRPQVTYRAFYERLIEWGRLYPKTTIGRELVWLDGVLDRVLEGGSWETTIPTAGDITWPPEEATFLRLVGDYDFWLDLHVFLRENGWDVDVTEQWNRVVVPTLEDWPDFEAYARQVVWYGRKAGATIRRAP